MGFVRTRREIVEVELIVLTTPSVEEKELEVVGLNEFLARTALGIDASLVSRRLGEVGDNVANGWNEGCLPPEIDPISVLSQATAAGMLFDFLEDAKKQNDRLRAMIEEDPAGKSIPTTAEDFGANYEDVGPKWYPELLKTISERK